MRPMSIAIVVATSLLQSGCNSRLSFSKTIDLGLGDDYHLMIDPPKYDQNVTVSFTSSDSPINIFVILKNDENSVTSSLAKEKTPPNALSHQENVKEGTLEAKVPAKNEAVVVLWGANKNTSVKVKIKG